MFGISNSTDAKHTWNEPWFFKLRAATRTWWMIRLAIGLGIYLALVGLLAIDDRADLHTLAGIANILVLSAAVTALFVVMIEVPTFQRLVTLSDNLISCVGTLMMYGGPLQLIDGAAGNWNRREIKQVQLLRQGEPGNRFPYGLMIVWPKYGSSKLIAVPTIISLDDVAHHVHSMGIEVQLSGWLPAAVSTQQVEVGK